MTVFHFTSGENLPSILYDGFLGPTAYDPHVITGGAKMLWATTEGERGDHTSKGVQIFKHGEASLVRFTLPKRGFVSWATLRRRRLQQVAEADWRNLDADADLDADDINFAFDDYELTALAYLGEPNTAAWHVHVGEFDIRRAKAIDITFDGIRWRPINPEFWRARGPRQTTKPKPCTVPI